MVVGRTGHALIALGHVGPRDGPPALAALRRAARAEGRLPALYKIPARFAGLARRSGMWVIRIGAEAVINPGTFSLSVPNRAGLRRKLRKASAVSVSVAVCEAPLPTGLHQIAQGWAARQGGERGFSMGRFCPEYLSHQRVYVARQNGEEIAFISLHVTDRVWTLDLIRHDGPLPDGTIHLLVTRAIEDAGLIGVAEVNLAAVPVGAFKGAPGYLRVLARWGGGTGLFQFKACFVPRWRPIYIATPRAGGALPVALGLMRAILRPAPVQGICSSADPSYPA
jgi:phosphatidylglycerol lysyltransferase